MDILATETQLKESELYVKSCVKIVSSTTSTTPRRWGSTSILRTGTTIPSGIDARLSQVTTTAVTSHDDCSETHRRSSGNDCRIFTESYLYENTDYIDMHPNFCCTNAVLLLHLRALCFDDLATALHER
jgi:hypothetical protein